MDTFAAIDQTLATMKRQAIDAIHDAADGAGMAMDIEAGALVRRVTDGIDALRADLAGVAIDVRDALAYADSGTDATTTPRLVAG